MQTSLHRHFNSGDELLYVGVSLSALNRLSQHAEHSDWFRPIARVAIEHFDTREAALAAERTAIIQERPRHNVHHTKVKVRVARKKARCVLLEVAAAKKDLTARVVQFNPVYSLQDAADELGVSMKSIRAWIRNGTIGHLTMPNINGRPVTYISGWQIIEHIENMISASPKPFGHQSDGLEF